LIVEYEVVDRFRKLLALPSALHSRRAVALALGRGSASGLDRIRGRSELVRGDVRTTAAWPAAYAACRAAPRRSLAAACARPAALRVWVILTSPWTQPRACSIA
jgi:hypothetical protein